MFPYHLLSVTQMAAGTLDASTKIYAVRVDAVHADVYKVLGGLGKDSQSTREEDGQDLGMLALFRGEGSGS